jgi:pimeloyl-ACP methyl ester carboxylesterase
MKTARAPPKYVLIAGAALRGWVWDRLIPLLDGPADTYDLPGTSTPEERRAFTWDEAVDRLATRLKASAKDVVLVGHSIGGLVASGIAHRASGNVRGVVYIGSYLPPPGKPHLHMAPPPMRIMMRTMLAMNQSGVKAPDAATRKAYCNDLDERTTEMVVSRATHEPPRIFHVAPPWDPRPPSTHRITYVRTTNDKAVRPHQQDAVVARLGAPRVVEIASGHLPMLARPQELAAAINTA